MTSYNYPGVELELFTSARNWKRYWSNHINPFIGQNVLDVGAGIGSNLELLWHVPASWTCLEPDPFLCQRLYEKANLLNASTFITVLNATISDLPITSDFDTILYIDVLEHIEKDVIELRNASNYLGNGGHLIVLAPAYQFLYSPFDKAIGHFRRYTKRSLLRATPKGFKLKYCSYLDSIGLFASLANKIVLRSRTPSFNQISSWDSFLVPASRVADKFLGYSFGRSVCLVWEKLGSSSSV